MARYYILLADKVASRVETRICTTPDDDMRVPVMQGSLWKVNEETGRIGKSTFDLYSVDNDGAVLRNFSRRSEEIQELPKEQFDLLHAVASCEQRFKVFQDKEWLAEAVHIQPGSVVYLVNLEGFTDTKIPGMVRYRGPLSGQNGTWFGVELSARYRGKGTSDGIFRKVRYFTCHMDSAIFKPVSKLACCQDPSVFVKSPVYEATPDQMKALPPPPPLDLGDRVVWISDTDSVEKATVKWIGVLPDVHRQPMEWMVGVEFDNRVGTGTGKYKNTQLFRTTQGYASLIPVMGLIKEDTFSLSATSSSYAPSSSSETRSSSTLTPEAITTSILETCDSAGNYTPTLPQKPHSSSFCSNTTELYNVKDKQCDEMAGGGGLNLTAEKKPVEATQDHLNHFNDRGNFTIHSSQPSHQAWSARMDERGAATTGHAIPNKFKNQDRYNRALVLDVPPERPEKHIVDKESKSIYDQHSYENEEHSFEIIKSEDYYEQVIPSGLHQRQFEEVDNWNDLPRSTTNGELIRQPPYKSSIDIRRYPPELCIHQDRFTMGSANGLDTQTHSFLSGEQMKRRDPSSTFEKGDGAAARRAQYQHSNTDPSAQKVHELITNLKFTGSPNSIEPSTKRHLDGKKSESRPSNFCTSGDLIYGNIGTSKSSRTRSVENIFKGIEHDPCPRITGNSVFYTSPRTNCETVDEAYKNLLQDDDPSSVTTPSSYVTAHENLTQFGGSLNSSTRQHQSSSCNDTYDSEAYTTPDEYKNWSEVLPESKPPSAALFDQTEKSRTESHANRAEISTGYLHTGSLSYSSDLNPVSMTPQEANTDLEIGSTVEVEGNSDSFKYGVVRWIGHFGDKRKPLVGLEMEVPNSSCTDGTFGRFRPFTCPPRKGFYVYLNKVKKDSRFQENPEFCDRSISQVFGSLECDDIPGDVIPPLEHINISDYTGRNRGIQGHQNSCYIDATLFSMFAFSTAFDYLLKSKAGNSVNTDRVQLALRQGIVNPLRKSFYVRADKVMNLRVVLNELNKVEGLTHAEKDPEEFLNCLLEDALKAEPFIALSSGLHSYLYQMILEKDCQIILPSTQQLLGLSFLQANLKLMKVPNILLMQLPRCGKKYKMYPRIVPTLSIDITDILHGVPRECAICSHLAEFECKDCFKHFGDGSLLEISFCEVCLKRSHSNPRRANHTPVQLDITDEMIAHYGKNEKSQLPIPRIKLQLSAIICIDTSHYVALVRAGHTSDAPWLFFDSMADRMGEQHGYNVPEVKLCRELPDWLWDNGHERILSCKDDRDLPEPVKRAVCDGYICLYEYKENCP